ncbi:hypothetical protein BKA62DRAFT_833284 [Auriculariales sp. MPI-PUGE-AT-0066]|nr:hypothetical protein BKA62DRAFT_833284 [Auriculariales sp. MPI-PUGE-AT-0066]
MASVHLPNEVWCSAWEHLSIMDCFAIAQVCRGWRRTACAWPRLWTQLSFKDYPESKPSTRSRYGECDCYEEWLVITDLQLLDLFADRSAPMPLDFEIKVLMDSGGDEDQAERLAEFSQLLARNASRLRSLVITIDSVHLVPKILYSLPRCLPHLKTLHITDSDLRGDQIELDFDTPALRNLQLYGLVPSEVLFNVITPVLHLLAGQVGDSDDVLKLLACASTVHELHVDVQNTFHPTGAETEIIRQRLPSRLDALHMECQYNQEMTHEYVLSNFYNAAIRDCSLYLQWLDDRNLQGFLADVTQPSEIWCYLQGESEEKHTPTGPSIASQTVGPARPCAVNTVFKLAVHSQLVDKVMRHIPCENAIQELRFYFESGRHREFDFHLRRTAEDEDYNVSLPKLQVLVLCIDRSNPERERPTIWRQKPSELAVNLSKALGLDGERPLQRLEFRELRFEEEDPVPTSCPWQSLAHEVLFT